ncbi:hypothetical protein FPV67DRAFT_996341 [Lyophyllum atratum]|nr:hypothetical protein FPV67DRAFT_996341 [Lyophyllum atratum]
MPFAINRVNEVYFNACILEALLRGIHFAIFTIALAAICTSPKRTGPSRWTLCLVVIALFLLATADLGALWAYVRRAFIAHGETSEAIAAALNEYPNWFLAMKSYSDASAVLADSVLIWRTWVIWGKSWKVTVIPVICTMLTIAFCVITTYQSITTKTFGLLHVDFVTGLYSATLVTTVFCTGAIIYRAVKVGGLRSYRSIIEILVEASVLYCFATIFALVAYIHNSTVYEYAFTFWIPMTGIAPTLVIARVAAGHARPDETWTVNHASTVSNVSFSVRVPPLNRPSCEASAHELTVSGSYAGGALDTRTFFYSPEASTFSTKPETLGKELCKSDQAV